MLEGQFTAKLLKEIRKDRRLSGAAVVKLSENFTKGIPDVLICVSRRTTYFEVKMDPARPEKIQRYWLARMQPSFVVIATRDGKRIWFEGETTAYNLEEMAEEIVARCLRS